MTKKLPGSRVARWGVVTVALLIAVVVEPLPPLLAWAESETWARIGEWIGLTFLGLIVLALMGESDTEVDLSTTGIGIRPGSTAGKGPDEIIGILTEEIAGLREDNALLAQQVTAGIEREKRLFAADVLPKPPGLEDHDG
jgi:hypothetical protein